MPIKRLLCPARVRRIPRQFSWIDQRLVRDEIIGRCGADALALYLFLMTVADARGLSYYSDPSIVPYLSFEADQLARARAQLQRVGLIAFEKPLYQVLALDKPDTPALSQDSLGGSSHRTVGPVTIGEMLRRALGGRDDLL